MRFAISLLLVVIIIGISLPVVAQTPKIQVFYDPAMGPLHTNRVCQGVGVLQTLYVIALDFNTFLSGAEFQLEYPPELVWIADQAVPPVTLGSTPAGISMGWATPLNAFGPVVLCEPLVMWTCDFCPVFNLHKVNVKPHPLFGASNPRVTDWPDNDLIEANGVAAKVCFFIATEETTWGQIKEIYRD